MEQFGDTVRDVGWRWLLIYQTVGVGVLPGKRRREKTFEETSGCSKGGHGDGWCNSRGGYDEVEEDDLL